MDHYEDKGIGMTFLYKRNSFFIDVTLSTLFLERVETGISVRERQRQLDDKTLKTWRTRTFGHSYIDP